MRRFAAFALAVLVAGLLVWRWRSAQSTEDAGSAAPAGEAVSAPAQSGKESSLEKPPVPAPASPPAPGPDDSQDGEKRAARFPGALAWLLRSRNADGSWGGDPEMFEGVMYTKHSATSLALLALLGAGYTHLSKEQCEGVTVGEAMKEALKWMMENKPESTLDTTIASLMWNEQFGMTSNPKFKEQAEATLQSLLAAQGEDGSWGGDAAASSWAAMALKSADISGLDLPREPWISATSWFAARMQADPRAADAVAWVLLTKERSGADMDRAKALLGARPPNWSQQDFGYWYHGSMAMFQLDGPKGPLFTQWGEGLKATLGGFQDQDGGWTGEGKGTADVVKNSMGQLTMEVWYRYQNVFAGVTKKK